MVMIIDMTNGEVEYEEKRLAPAPETVEMQCPQSDWREPGLALVEVSLEVVDNTFPAEMQDVDLDTFMEMMEQSAGR